MPSEMPATDCQRSRICAATSRIESCEGRPWAVLSSARRGGSRTVRTSRAISKPGAPTARNVKRHEAMDPTTGRSITGMRLVASTTIPPTISASPEPSMIPIE